MTESIEAPPAMPAKIAPGPQMIVGRLPLLSAIEFAAGILLARSPKPILQCVLLDAGNDCLVVRATNLEQTVQVVIRQVQIESAGKCAVMAHKFMEVLKASTQDAIKIASVGENMVVTDENSVSRLLTGKVEDMPPMPEGMDEKKSIVVPMAPLVKILSRALLFIGKIANRYAWNGVLLKAKKGNLAICATNGKSLYADALPIEGSDLASAIVPTSAINRLMKMTGDEVKITFSGNQVFFSVDDALVASVIIEGQFPPYEDVVPKDTDKRFVVGREDLASAVRKASRFTTEESKGIRLRFSKKGCILTSRSPELGDAEVNLPAKYEGADMEIRVNPGLLLNCLTGDGEEVTMEMNAPNRSILVRDGTNAQCVVMPVNVA